MKYLVYIIRPDDDSPMQHPIKVDGLSGLHAARQVAFDAGVGEHTIAVRFADSSESNAMWVYRIEVKPPVEQVVIKALSGRVVCS